MSSEQWAVGSARMVLMTNEKWQMIYGNSLRFSIHHFSFVIEGGRPLPLSPALRNQGQHPRWNAAAKLAAPSGAECILPGKNVRGRLSQ
jgi:hypothetical protein